MEKRELKRVVYEYTIDGQQYQVKKPNLKLLKEFMQKTKDAKVDEADGGLEALEETINFLARLGLPAEVAWELDPEMLQDITAEVTGQKKS